MLQRDLSELKFITVEHGVSVVLLTLAAIVQSSPRTPKTRPLWAALSVGLERIATEARLCEVADGDVQS